MYEEDENTVIPFTLRHRRRIDRTERAVSGYTDEGGVFVPGLLQNTADGIVAMKRIRTLAYILCAMAIVNSLHLYGIFDFVKGLVLGFKQ